VDELAKLISRLQRLGYRTQTFGTEIVVEFDAHSKLCGSASQIERILPRLEKGFKPAARLAKATSGKKKEEEKRGKLK
jgi:hypothetical protein